MRTLSMSIAAVLCSLAIGACSSKPQVYAPESELQAVRHVAPPPPEVRLYTVINKGNGAGEHSGLLINGSQRVLFDPAGTWDHPLAPERHDVKYGIDDHVLALYVKYHVREEYDMVVQTVRVPLPVADDLIARAEKAGPVADAFCATSITGLLTDTPGFKELRGSLFPLRLMEGFVDIPGVHETRITHATVDDGDPGLSNGLVKHHAKGQTD